MNAPCSFVINLGGGTIEQANDTEDQEANS
jgi:hypothetical protein